MDIIWSPRAQKRITEYARQLAEYDYPETARNWILTIRMRAETLADFPRSRRISPEFKARRPVVRDITIGKYRLFYRIHRGSVEVISIHNCKNKRLHLFARCK